ncbi:MAG: FimV/HubP family polar landmark protein [Pseudomonadota bacterium]
MLKSIFKAVLITGVLLLPSWALAAGLGKLTVISALGQPLRAEIELAAVQPEELATLSARLASPQMFRQANIQYAAVLTGIKFSIEKRANGTPYVKLVSAQAVNEPFLDMLVELSWASGRLVREYTALLDPPGYTVPEAPAARPDAVVSPVQEPAPAPAAEAAPAPEAEQPPMEPQPEQPAEQPAAEAVLETAGELPALPPPVEAVDYGPVKRGDTLNKIAAQLKPEGVSLDQMLVGLYRENQGAFAGKNMNRLKVGKILRIPDAETLAAIGQRDARKEIHAHVVNWNAYRQKLAAVTSEVTEAPAKQEAAGKITTSVGEKMPAQPSAQDVLKLSKGEPLGGIAAKDAKAMQERVRQLEEEAIAREKALKEANQRVTQLEKNIQDMQRLLDLKNGGMAQVQKQAETKPEAAAAPAPIKEAPTSAPELAPAVTTPPQAPTQPKQAPPPPPQPGLLEQILGEPLYLAAAGGVVVLLGLAGLLAVRRKRAAVGIGKPSVLSTSVAAAAEKPQEDLSATSVLKAMGTVEEVDPVAEAEVYIAYGRDAQAETILKEALSSSPQREDVSLKLLEIYSSRKDPVAFENQARQLHGVNGGQGEVWLKVARMGYALDPQNELYAAGKPEGGEQVVEAAPAPSIDTSAVDLDLTIPPASPEGIAAQVPAVDFSVEEHVMEEPAANEKTAEQGNVVDFDFNPTLPEEGAKAAQDDAEKTVIMKPEAASDLGIDFNLGDTGQAAPGPGMDAGGAAQPVAVPAVDFSSIDLGLEGGSAAKPEAAAAKGERWYDVQTKFDLAKAYQEMGDKEGAREILQEVLQEGDDQQKADAQALLDKLG